MCLFLQAGTQNHPAIVGAGDSAVDLRSSLRTVRTRLWRKSSREYPNM